MLIKNHTNLEKNANIDIKRVVKGKATRLGAFEEGTVLTLSVTLPRRLGASGVVLRINRDGEEAQDVPFDYTSLEGGSDCYQVKIKGEKGLYFYEILLLRGFDTLFVSSVNNLDFVLTDSSESKFTLLFYQKGFNTPHWVKGGIMYHIFVDRFKRGEGEVSPHGVINEDWEKGIPQYAEKVGDPLSNDVFFGGNLWGVAEKLDYLASLGVNIIYLSPVFESVSNHRYDTGDYEKIDSLLGGDEAFDNLIEKAHARGMKVILDGVFNHTGDDSRYFNKRGSYAEVGAYQSEDSPYANWFNFTEFPNSYEAWWGIEIMPRLKHGADDCRRYFTSEGGIVERWLGRGADGWRLDVADELSDEFLDELNATAKGVKDAFVLGEVWENGVTKTSYGKRRRYFHGAQLDSVMNYPLRNAIISLLSHRDAEGFYNTVTELYSSYPKPVLDSLMNIISTHDTERILTLLGDPTAGEDKTNAELSVLRLSSEKRAEAKKLLKLASVIQYTIFGFPSVYYGDEAGVEGYHDPFCRMPYPWGREDKELISHYKMLGKLREKHPCLKDGGFEFLRCDGDLVIYRRKGGKDTLTVYLNLTDTPIVSGRVKIEGKSFKII
ncbi:MAG: glycoside hydrolase family 13 protein [Clostridia bacterium]|nr:glycoside hydrolase family 13 protein [Clostridia bacterium]